MKMIPAYLIASLLLSLSFAEEQAAPENIAEPPLPVVEPPLPVVEPHPGAPYLELATEYMVVYDELGSVLAGVNDFLTAEKATPKVQSIVQQLAELTTRESVLPSPTPDIVEYVNEQLKTVDSKATAERSLGKVIDLLTLTDPPCHGSRTLEKELYAMISVLSGN